MVVKTFLNDNEEYKLKEFEKTIVSLCDDDSTANGSLLSSPKLNENKNATNTESIIFDRLKIIFRGKSASYSNLCNRINNNNNDNMNQNTHSNNNNNSDYTISTNTTNMHTINDNTSTRNIPSEVTSTPLEVQSNSSSTAVEASSNYLSLKSKATPGDRGNCEVVCENGGNLHHNTKLPHNTCINDNVNIPVFDFKEPEFEVKNIAKRNMNGNTYDMDLMNRGTSVESDGGKLPHNSSLSGIISNINKGGLLSVDNNNNGFTANIDTFDYYTQRSNITSEEFSLPTAPSKSTSTEVQSNPSSTLRSSSPNYLPLTVKSNSKKFSLPTPQSAKTRTTPVSEPPSKITSIEGDVLSSTSFPIASTVGLKDSSPLEVTTLSSTRRGGSSNYSSLKSMATPGDRGSVEDRTSSGGASFSGRDDPLTGMKGGTYNNMNGVMDTLSSYDVYKIPGFGDAIYNGYDDGRVLQSIAESPLTQLVNMSVGDTMTDVITPIDNHMCSLDFVDRAESLLERYLMGDYGVQDELFTLFSIEYNINGVNIIVPIFNSMLNFCLMKGHVCWCVKLIQISWYKNIKISIDVIAQVLLSLVCADYIDLCRTMITSTYSKGYNDNLYKIFIHGLHELIKRDNINVATNFIKVIQDNKGQLETPIAVMLLTLFIELSFNRYYDNSRTTSTEVQSLPSTLPLASIVGGPADSSFNYLSSDSRRSSSVCLPGDRGQDDSIKTSDVIDSFNLLSVNTINKESDKKSLYNTSLPVKDCKTYSRGYKYGESTFDVGGGNIKYHSSTMNDISSINPHVTDTVDDDWKEIVYNSLNNCYNTEGMIDNNMSGKISGCVNTNEGEVSRFASTEGYTTSLPLASTVGPADSSFNYLSSDSRRSSSVCLPGDCGGSGGNPFSGISINQRSAPNSNNSSTTITDGNVDFNKRIDNARLSLTQSTSFPLTSTVGSTTLPLSVDHSNYFPVTPEDYGCLPAADLREAEGEVNRGGSLQDEDKVVTSSGMSSMNVLNRDEMKNIMLNDLYSYNDTNDYMKNISPDKDTGLVNNTVPSSTTTSSTCIFSSSSPFNIRYGNLINNSLLPSPYISSTMTASYITMKPFKDWLNLSLIDSIYLAEKIKSLYIFNKLNQKIKYYIIFILSLSLESSILILDVLDSDLNIKLFMEFICIEFPYNYTSVISRLIELKCLNSYTFINSLIISTKLKDNSCLVTKLCIIALKQLKSIIPPEYKNFTLGGFEFLTCIGVNKLIHTINNEFTINNIDHICKILTNKSLYDLFTPLVELSLIIEDFITVEYIMKYLVHTYNHINHVICEKIIMTLALKGQFNNINRLLKGNEPHENCELFLTRIQPVSQATETLSTNKSFQTTSTVPLPPEVASTEGYTTTVGLPPEVGLADSSFNYSSLKSIATPGDRGEGSDGSSIMGMMKDGAKDVLDVTSSGMKSSTGPRVEPGADLREAEGELNREDVCKTTSGGMASGKMSRTGPQVERCLQDDSIRWGSMRGGSSLEDRLGRQHHNRYGTLDRVSSMDSLSKLSSVDGASNDVMGSFDYFNTMNDDYNPYGASNNNLDLFKQSNKLWDTIHDYNSESKDGISSITRTTPVNEPPSKITNTSTPLDIQSTSFPIASTVGLADSSFNYSSLKSVVTPGDRGSGEGRDLSGVSTGPQVEPAADLREAEGEVNREGLHGEWKERTSGGDRQHLIHRVPSVDSLDTAVGLLLTDDYNVYERLCSFIVRVSMVVYNFVVALQYVKPLLRRNIQNVEISSLIIYMCGRIESRSKLENFLSFCEKISILIDENGFSSILDCCIKLKNTKRLLRLINKFRIWGMQPQIQTYGIIVKSLSCCGMIDECKKLWDEFIYKRGLEPNEIMYGCMFDAFVNNNRVDDAMKLFYDMKSRGKVKPNTIMYTTLIKGFGQNRQLDKALNIFNMMNEEGVLPNTVTYNSIIDACARVGDMNGAASLLENMLNNNIEPDLITFSTIIKGYCVQSNMDKSFQLLSIMYERGIMPDVILYNSLLEGCVKSGLLWLCEKLWEQMQQYNIPPSNFTLTILIKMYGRNGQLDKVFDLADRLPKEYGFTINTHVYTCLMSACITNGKYHIILDIYKCMKNAGIKADAKTFETLIQGTSKGNLFIEAADIISDVYSLTNTNGDPNIPNINTKIIEKLFHKVHTHNHNPHITSIYNSLARRLELFGIKIHKYNDIKRK